ncbi:MFS transporter [Streptomyces sp. NPDC004065]|uniref:MFS transporter n=1 Tax=Streptomyces sp. NPDC004065 TaxID=3364689 RepID=UPI0038517DF2
MEPTAAAARAAVFGYFGINGTALALWVAHIPDIKRDLDLSSLQLGAALLVVAGGALAAMQIAGRLIDRAGSAAVTRAGGTALPLTLLGPAFAPSLPWLVLSLALLGAANGLMDVSMNGQAVEVERRYGRPIMSAFHAVFSVGGVAGAGAGALLLGLDVPREISLPAAALILGSAAVALRSRLLPKPAPSDTDDADEDKTRAKGRLPLLATLLGCVAFSSMVVEGAAADWGGVHLQETVDADNGVAALAYAAFAGAMTTGRALGDRIVARHGSVMVVRWGGTTAAAGLALVVWSGHLVPILLGWLLAGAGVSTVVPQIFTAAGNLSTDQSGAALARAATLGYFGFLAGPPLVGSLADRTSLSTALLTPLLLAVTVALSGPLIRRAGASAPTPAPAGPAAHPDTPAAATGGPPPATHRTTEPSGEK